VAFGGVKNLKYSDDYLKRYYDEFKFFDPECRDKRVREIMMRTKRCLVCPGLADCKMHPEFWMAGEPERIKMDEKLRKSGA